MAKSNCIVEGFEEVNAIVSKCPKLEKVACKKVKEIVSDLEWRLKVYCEWEELKAKEKELFLKIEIAKDVELIKLHAEVEEIKGRIHTCEVQLELEVEEFKEKVEYIAHEINPIDKIKFGFLKFKAHFHRHKDHFSKLVDSHKPKYLIFSCCDSRVDPCKILNLEVGEAIVVRNVGSLVAAHHEEGLCPSIGASIEYAVKQLKVEHILVIGHSKCESIHALFKSLYNEVHEEKVELTETFKSWLKIVEDACKKVKEEHANVKIEEQFSLCEKECINHSVKNCLSYPIVKEAVAQKTLTIHAGYYDISKCTFDRWSLDVKLTKEETHLHA